MPLTMRAYQTEDDSPARDQYPAGYWDDQFEYLRQARILQHNNDYLEFLVTRVWKLDRPCRVIDFGCGYGKFGTMLLPLLPGGSTYTGVDQSLELIAQARRMYAAMPYPSEFFEGSVYHVPFDDSTFDVAASHTVLMHIPHPEKAIQEMIRVTRHNGLIVTCDTSRNAHAALFHIDETNEQETRPLGLTQTINRAVREQTGVDYNIGLKTPILMHRAGLKNVGTRISDSVRLLFPPVDTDEKDFVRGRGPTFTQRS
jgi:SAM-dependent methyltransferase